MLEIYEHYGDDVMFFDAYGRFDFTVILRGLEGAWEIVLSRAWDSFYLKKRYPMADFDKAFERYEKIIESNLILSGNEPIFDQSKNLFEQLNPCESSDSA